MDLLTLSRIKMREWTLTALVMLLTAGSVFAQAQSRSRSRKPSATPQKKAQSSAEFDQAVKLGDEARLAGRLSDALDLYGKALQIRPEWPEGWWNVATIFYE